MLCTLEQFSTYDWYCLCSASPNGRVDSERVRSSPPIARERCLASTLVDLQGNWFGMGGKLSG